MSATRIGISIIAALYATMSITCMFLYGSQINSAGSDILVLINQENSLSSSNHWESYVLRFLFLVVLACHIPFIFFSGKEGALIMVDEINRRSISSLLNERVMALELADQLAKEVEMHGIHMGPSGKTVELDRTNTVSDDMGGIERDTKQPLIDKKEPTIRISIAEEKRLTLLSRHSALVGTAVLSHQSYSRATLLNKGGS